jgi:hypothetical protein
MAPLPTYPSFEYLTADDNRSSRWIAITTDLPILLLNPCRKQSTSTATTESPRDAATQLCSTATVLSESADDRAESVQRCAEHITLELLFFFR